MENKKRQGVFIALEGIDGSGKSTQIKYLEEKLKQNNILYYTTMEPTDSPIGSLIHQIMVGRIETDNQVVAALFLADRLDHLLNKVNGIAAKIQEGVCVITDRYYFSSYAYHSVDMPMDWVIQANTPCSAILRPTATIFLDVSPDTAMERIQKGRFQQELFEKKSRLAIVREKYLESFETLKGTENIAIVDGNQDPIQVSEAVWEIARQYFKI